MNALLQHSSGRKRVRLNPAVRSALILDAALAEFSHKGFSATRMEDIAARAGLSKAGLYAHFASKDEIFEQLLTRAFTLPVSAPGPHPQTEPDSPRRVVQAFVDALYAPLENPDFLAMLRLLLNESGRVGSTLHNWEHGVLEPYLQRHKELIERGVSQGGLRSSVLSENFAIAISPMVHAAMRMVLFPDLMDAAALAGFKRANQAMILQLLEIQ